MKKILYILGVMLAVASCTKTDEGFDNPNSGDGAVQFMASAPTRVTEDSEWQADDRIGVFAGSVSNTEYKIKADNSGAMEYVSGKAIYAPSSSQSYYGYYPYDADINGSKLSVDLTSNQLPLVWAKAENMSGSNVTFDFKHQLVKLNLTFRAGGLDIANLDGATATLKGANTKGEFDVVTGAWNSSATVAEDLPLTIATTEASTTLTIYVMPTTSPNANTTIEISAGSKNFVWQPTTTAWEVGNTYDYNVTVGAILDIALVEGVYQIYSAKGMKAFADLVNGNSNSSNAITSGDGFATFGNENTSINGQLMCDIELSSICSETSGVNWEPIGYVITMMNYRGYTGTFDGGGCEISGLYINYSTDAKRQALFGYTSGTIKNLGVSGSVTSTTSGAAGVVAIASGAVENCYNLATVKGAGQTGGVVGVTFSTSSSATVTNCYNRGSVEGSSDVGGVVGSADSSVANCYNTGSVEGDSSNVGGVVGFAAAEFNYSVTNCYWLDTAFSGDGVGVTSGSVVVENVEGKSAGDMTSGTFASPLGSAFKEDYSTPINNGYPILTWQ